MSNGQSIADLLELGDVSELLAPPMYGPGSRCEEMEKQRALYPLRMQFKSKKQPINSEERKAKIRELSKEMSEIESQGIRDRYDPNSAYNQKFSDPNSAYNQKIKAERERFTTEYKESKDMAKDKYLEMVKYEYLEVKSNMLKNFETGPAYFGIVEDPDCFKNPCPPGSAPSKEAIAANMTAKALLGLSHGLRERAAEILWGEKIEGVFHNPWPEAYGADYEYKFRGLGDLDKRQRTE